MSPLPEVVLTSRDFAILEAMLDDTDGRDDMLVLAIRSKLSAANIVLSEDLPPNVVSVGTRLRFSIDSHPFSERTLTMPDRYLPDGTSQSLATARGIAMLGLGEGASVEVPYPGRTETLTVLSILFQPEADRRARAAKVLPFVRRPARFVPNGDGDGPSAA